MNTPRRCEPLENMARNMIGASGLAFNLLFVTQEGTVVAVIVENHYDAIENALNFARGLSGKVVVEKTDYGVYWENEASLDEQRRLAAEEEAEAEGAQA